jgi:hypothetical protein
MFSRKILTYYIRSDKSVEKKKFKFKENKITIEKDREILFSPEHLFLRKRLLLPPEPCLILLEGKSEPEKIGNPTVSIPNLFPPMTYGEIAELIKREIAKARMRIKPLSLNLFIILFIMQIVTIVLLFAVMKGVHIG